MTSTKYSKPNMTHQTIASPVDSAPERDLTPRELRELFGEDENGNLLPEQELNAILDRAYALIFAAKDQVTKLPAQGNRESKKSMTDINANDQKTENVSKPAKSEPTKAAKASKKSDVPSDKNAQKENGVLKPSAEINAAEAFPKSKAKAKAPSETPKERGVWNSVLQLCQQIEVYPGVKVDEYHGFDSIAKILGEIELEENSLRLMLLKHADGLQELIVSGVLNERDATELNDARDTSIIDLSRRVQFQPDVQIEEYADEAVLEVIEATSPDFDHDRVFSTVYQHPDGRVEYVISGPVVHADSTEQTVTAKSNPPNTPPAKTASEGDELLVLIDENGEPVLKDTTLTEVSTSVAAAAPKAGKRKRAASNDEEAPTEQTVPKNKKSRKNQVADSKTAPTGRAIATPKKKKGDGVAATTSAPAPAAKGKRRREADDDGQSAANDSPVSKKARTEAEDGSESAAKVRPRANPKGSRRGAAATAVAAEASPENVEGRSVAGDQEETSTQDEEQAAAGRPIAVPKKSNRGAAGAPISSTAPKTKGKLGGDDNVPETSTAAPKEKSKRPTKKPTGTARKGGKSWSLVLIPTKYLRRSRQRSAAERMTVRRSKTRHPRLETSV